MWKAPEPVAFILLALVHVSIPEPAQIIVSGPGILTSPNYPENYGPNLNMEWVLTPASSDAVVHLYFTDFETEESYDWLTIRDGGNATDPIAVRHSGIHIMAPPAISKRGGSLYVRFTTDANMHFRGFQSNYDLKFDRIFVENLTTTAVNGSRSSPHYYDGRYPIDMEYVWNIKAFRYDTLVQVTFIWIRVENNIDYVELLDGDNVVANLSYYYSIGPTQGFISDSNEMQVRFVVNSQNAMHDHRGFRMTFELIEPTPVDPEATASKSYGIKADFSWHFHAIVPDGKVTINFGSTFIRDGYDYVEVRDGHLSTSPLLANITGRLSNAGPISSSGVSIYIRLRGYENNSNYGNLFMYAVTSSIREEFEATVGTISTPGTYTYAIDARYSWIIRRPVGRIYFYIHEGMSTVEGSDFVTVYDGNSTISPLLGTRSGTPPAWRNHYLSTGPEMLITFTSWSPTPSTGFEGTFQSITTDTHIIRSDKDMVLTAPNYPLPTPQSISWRWEIAAGFSHVQLTFDEFSTVDPGDSLRVFDGTSAFGPLLGEFWGNEGLANSSLPPTSLRTNRNGVYVEYNTTEDMASQGFKINLELRGWEADLNPTGDEFSSVQYPEPYYTYAQQSWVLSCPNSKVAVVFHDFELGGGRSDVVSFRNGNSSFSSLIASFAGGSVPHPIYSPGEQMRVEFSALGAQTTARGFRASFVCSADVHMLSDTSGEILSPHYPQNYSNGLDQTWIISVQLPNPDAVIEVEIMEFDSEQDVDVLVIRDGDSPEDPILAELSGSTTDELVIQSSANKMYLNFASDSAWNSTGFKILYRTSTRTAEMPIQI